MPHLNEINEKYGQRGLSVVAVSREKYGVIDEFVRGERVGYPVARSSGASGLYGVSGIPDSFIIGKDGKVLWRGHPGDINDSMLAAWLGGQPLPAGSPAPSEGSSITSMFFKLGVFIMLSGVAVFFVLRMLKPGTPQTPVYPTQAWPQQMPNMPPPGPSGGSAPTPPAPVTHCPHCGSPKREGRKNCMGCGAPL